MIGYTLEILSNNITGCTMCIKSEWIKKVLPFPNNKNILHDYWIAIIISINGKIVYLNKPTIKYRQHLNNQVGTKKYTDTLKSFGEIRNHLINIRIENFETFTKNKNIFTNEQNIMNEKALNYFNIIKNKKVINFRKINVFNKLYKNCSWIFYIGMFLIFNIPILALIIYKLKIFIRNLRG